MHSIHLVFAWETLLGGNFRAGCSRQIVKHHYQDST